MTDSNGAGKKQVIAYGIVTLAFCVPMAAGGVLDLVQAEQVATVFRHLGYPLYFASMLGVFKLLGVAVLLAPAWPRAKEWAYAGFGIDLIAALVSHLAVDGVTADAVPPIVILALCIASWRLRPPTRRLAGAVL